MASDFLPATSIIDVGSFETNDINGSWKLKIIWI
jgi:hypothetical protein